MKNYIIILFISLFLCEESSQVIRDYTPNGVIDAAKETKISVPLVVRLAGTNFQEGKKILTNSGLKIISANNLGDAAKKIVKAIR